MVDTKGLKISILRRDGVGEESRSAAGSTLDEIIDEGDYLTREEIEDEFDIFHLSDFSYNLFKESS